MSRVVLFIGRRLQRFADIEDPSVDFDFLQFDFRLLGHNFIRTAKRMPGMRFNLRGERGKFILNQK